MGVCRLSPVTWNPASDNAFNVDLPTLPLAPTTKTFLMTDADMFVGGFAKDARTNVLLFGYEEKEVADERRYVSGLTIIYAGKLEKAQLWLKIIINPLE